MAAISLANDEIVRAVLQVTGLGRDEANMSAETEADVRHIIRSGLRRFFFPTVGEGENAYVHQWRWLEKYHPIPIEDVFDDGTIAITAGAVTLTGGTFPTDLTDYFIYVDGHVLFVTARGGDTTATVSHNQITVAAGTTYTAYKYRYALPSDFGEWLGGVVYQDGARYRSLANASEMELRMRYASGTFSTTQITHYAITQTPGSSGAVTSRIMFWPIGEPEAFAQGIYLSVPDDNLPADLTVPGSTVQVQPIYAEAVLEAILTAAEEYNNDMNGVHSTRFQSAILKAIAHDRSIGGAYDFGHRAVTPSRGRGPVASEIDFTDAL